MDLMNKQVLPFLFSLSLLFMIFIMGLELIIFDESYFEWHYEHRGITATTEMSLEDLMTVTHDMLGYLSGERPTLDMQSTIAGVKEEVFGDREKAHMVDVRDLYLGARSIRRSATIFVTAMLLLSWLFSKKLLYHMLNRVKYIVPALLVVVGIIGGLFATDFNKYFTMFHELFFDNDLWLLNPKTDILINMVPESYFYSIGMIGLALFAVMIILAIVLSSIAADKLADYNKIGLKR